jgi:hypothetical protein
MPKIELTDKLGVSAVTCSSQTLRGIRHTHMTSSLHTNQVRTVLNRSAEGV